VKVVPQPDLLLVSEPVASNKSNFETAAELGSFFQNLTQARFAKTPVHILQFGDSHTASDDWVNEMRAGLQSRYGNGGAGFTLPGRPFKGYRRYDISGTSSEGWVPEGTVMHPSDGRAGLSGICMTAHAAGQFLTLRTSGELLEIHYLQQPAGGAFEFSVDGQLVEAVSTRGEPGAGIYRYQPPPGDHDYRLRTMSSDPVRIFGWTSDRASGVTFETLGINGAHASMIRTWDNAIWQPEVASRKPALIILEYGTNEANSPKWTRERYVADLESVIARVRAAAPDASLLMVGPPDCGKLRPLTHLDEVIDLQRQVSLENHVAFWNWRERMGGPRAIVRWAQAGFGQPDHVHLTGAGYRLIGKTLVEDLLSEYSSYLARQSQAVHQSPSL